MFWKNYWEQFCFNYCSLLIKQLYEKNVKWNPKGCFEEIVAGNLPIVWLRKMAEVEGYVHVIKLLITAEVRCFSALKMVRWGIRWCIDWPSKIMWGNLSPVCCSTGTMWHWFLSPSLAFLARVFMQTDLRDRALDIPHIFHIFQQISLVQHTEFQQIKSLSQTLFMLPLCSIHRVVKILL